MVILPELCRRDYQGTMLLPLVHNIHHENITVLCLHYFIGPQTYLQRSSVYVDAHSDRTSFSTRFSEKAIALHTNIALKLCICLYLCG